MDVMCLPLPHELRPRLVLGFHACAAVLLWAGGMRFLGASSHVQVYFCRWFVFFNHGRLTTLLQDIKITAPSKY